MTSFMSFMHQTIPIKIKISIQINILTRRKRRPAAIAHKHLFQHFRASGITSFA